MQQAIEEAKKMRDELDRIQRKSYMEYRHLKIDAINELIERLEKLPQEPTTEPTLEMLLEEMPDTFMNISRMKDGTKDWHAMASDKEWLNTYSGYGTSPRLAILALKEKLSIN